MSEITSIILIIFLLRLDLMFLHNDIYCKHLIEALIKLRNISDQGNETIIMELSVRNSDCYWAWYGLDSAQKKPCTNHHDLNLKFSRETRFVPIGAFHFVLQGAFSSVSVLKVIENHIEIRRHPRHVTCCMCRIWPGLRIRSPIHRKTKAAFIVPEDRIQSYQGIWTSTF